jgi:prepilin-type N-terminal cleavage/methylation domain-containing protein
VIARTHPQHHTEELSMRHRPRGFTLVELLVVMAIIALLLGLLLPALARARNTARQVKDSTQIKQVHSGLVTAAADSNGSLPLPGEINRRGVLHGRGAQDERVNNHANLYGAMIARGYMNAQILVSPAESNTKVIPATRYNMAQINPALDRYWDPVDQLSMGEGTGGGAVPNPITGFQANLQTMCNTSYATMPIDPSIRRKVEWRSTGNSRFACVGNRGTRGGVQTGAEFTNSKTLLIHGSTKEWDGNIAYNDNHTEFGRTMYPENVAKLRDNACAGGTALTGAEQRLDNLFKNDTFCISAVGRRNSDCWLVVQRRSPNEGQSDGVATFNAFDGPTPDFITWD